MRIIALALLSCFILTSCSGQGNDKPKDSSQTSERDRINTLFNFEAKRGSLLTCEEEEKFFSALPTNFQEYKNFFCKRFTLNDGRKLYLTRTLSSFQNLYCIESSRMSETLFKWSKDANVEDGCETFSRGSSGGYFDAVINLQELTQTFFATRFKGAIKIFENQKDEDIKSFWHFYFDSPHPESYKEDFEVLYNRYAEKDERVAKLMKEEFEKLLSESDGHGH